MPKIVVAQNLEFYPDQVKRIQELGETTFYNDRAKSPEEWLGRVKDADIICSGSAFMKTEVYKLNDKFFTIPMVGYSWLDINKLKAKNITVANCPGCNKYAVTEWIVAMTINLLRNLPSMINASKLPEKISGVGLKDKNITILGKGNIGQLAGQAFSSLGAKITYFQRNDNLANSVKNADVIVNCLSTNPTTIGLLDKSFFLNLKKDSYFISITPEDIYDTEAMLQALDKGTLAGVANDCASITTKDTNDERYQELPTHPKILATPHIAWLSDVSKRDENDMMIDNITAWLKGQPINIIK